jgi:hypothetical protein
VSDNYNNQRWMGALAKTQASKARASTIWRAGTMSAGAIRCDAGPENPTEDWGESSTYTYNLVFRSFYVFMNVLVESLEALS